MTESNRSGSRRTFLGALAAAWPAARLLRAQEQDTKFSTDVKVVNILATVRDKQGHMVSVLGKDDFNVSEDGRPQTIKYFSHETDLPLTLGLLVDTSMSQRRVLGQERSACLRFLDRVLRAQKDKTFVIHFDFETELLQDLTSNRADLQHALDQLELPANGGPQMRRAGGGGGGYPGGGGGGGRSGGGTTLYDAIYLAANEIMKPLPRDLRKAVILLTDGVDHGSKTFLNDAIEAAQRSDTIAYSVLFADEQQQQRSPISFGGMGGGMGGGRRGGMGRPPAQRVESVDGKKILQRISRETGGSFFEVTKKLSIDDIFDKIQEELRNQYSIGYVPDQAESSGYRAIKVTTKQSGMTVQAREGYYPR
jgi:VWFA-related protein